MKRITYLIFILMVATACKETFEAPPQSLVQISLLGSVSKKSITPTVSALGMGRDSLWILDEPLSQLLLPLSSTGSSAYLVSFDSKVDTLLLYHQTSLKYASMETGFYYEYKLDSIYFTHNRIDSLQVADSLVTSKWHENIKLYIHPLLSGNN